MARSSTDSVAVIAYVLAGFLALKFFPNAVNAILQGGAKLMNNVKTAGSSSVSSDPDFTPAPSHYSAPAGPGLGWNGDIAYTTDNFGPLANGNQYASLLTEDGYNAGS